jgi:hypothetical protein
MAINPGINLAHFVDNGAVTRGSFFRMSDISMSAK